MVDIRGSALAYVVWSRRRAVMRPRPGPRVAHLAAVPGLAEPPAPVARSASEDDRRAFALLLPGRPFVALGPAADRDPRLWPPERFMALFNALAEGPLPGAIDPCGALALAEAAVDGPVGRRAAAVRADGGSAG